MNEIIEEILNTLRAGIPDIDKFKVERACLGLGYTGVKLDNGHAGICHTLRNEMAIQHCGIMEKAGSLAGSSAIDLAKLATSWNLVERILGIAIINALSQTVFQSTRANYQIKEGNLIDEVKIKADDIVAMVGYIRPFKSRIESRARKLYIFERTPTREKNILPDVACEDILPEADVVIITGSSIANGTLDRVLDLSHNAREITISGPTASFIPDPLFRRKVKAVGGVQIVDPEKMFKIIAEGGGTPQLKPVVKFIVIKPEKSLL